MDHTITDQGSVLFGPDMRLGTHSIWEHQIQYLLRRPPGSHAGILSVIGHGNLTQNPYFVAWIGHSGELIRLHQEPVSARTYDCLLVEANGTCSMRELRFETRGRASDVAGWRAVDTSGQHLSNTVEGAFSGQRIVKNGQPLTRAQLAEQVLSGLYYDLRHVFRFPAVRQGGYWKDVGLEQFYDHGRLNRAAVAKALEGSPIVTRWRDLTDDQSSVRTAFVDKGFVEGFTDRGGFRFHGDYVEIFYLDALYCHNVIGLDAQGDLISMQVTGWSNNVGSSLYNLSRLAAQVFVDAILLDNGGDVFYFRNCDPNRYREIPFEYLDDPQWTLVPSCENRYALRATVLFVSDEPSMTDIQPFRPTLQANAGTEAQQSQGADAP